MGMLDGFKLSRLKKQASDLRTQMEQYAITETKVNANTVNTICKMGFELKAIEGKIEDLEKTIK